MSKDVIWKLGIIGVLAIVAGAGLLQSMTTVSNCGGNSAALGAVHDYVNLAVVEAMDAPNQQFSVTAATPEQRRQISRLPNANRRAHFLVSTVPFIPRSNEPRRVVIICDTFYTNVPKQRFFKSPPTHAAGFSDGTTGLISPKEFATLDRTTFVAIDELFPKEKLTPEN